MGHILKGFPGGSDGKESACSTGGPGSPVGQSRGEGRGYPAQCSCLEDPWTEEPGGLQSTGSQRVRHNGQLTHSCLLRLKHLLALAALPPWGCRLELPGLIWGSTTSFQAHQSSALSLTRAG